MVDTCWDGRYDINLTRCLIPLNIMLFVIFFLFFFFFFFFLWNFFLNTKISNVVFNEIEARHIQFERHVVCADFLLVYFSPGSKKHFLLQKNFEKNKFGEKDLTLIEPTNLSIVVCIWGVLKYFCRVIWELYLIFKLKLLKILCIKKILSKIINRIYMKIITI